MGTRNLTMVILDGKPAIAQYGQWDGYPSGQGRTALTFARDKMYRPMFLERLRAVHWLTQEEIEAAYKAAGHDGKSDWVGDAVANKFREAFPLLTRDHGAEILNLVQMSEGPINLVDQSDFAADSLSCEWAYVIDLDKNTFEAYRGFNHDPVPPGERFSDLPMREYKGIDTKYYPIKHLHTWPLDALPTDKDFETTLEPPEEDEAAA